MIEIKAPKLGYIDQHPIVFLAGSIEQGAAEMWQDRVVKLLADDRGTILNPRRDDWDASWKCDLADAQFVAQVRWEQMQNAAHFVIFYFDTHTHSPITLLEFGMACGICSSKRPPSQKYVVVCPEGFWRKGNVDVMCQLYGIDQVPTLEAAAEWIRERM